MPLRSQLSLRKLMGLRFHSAILSPNAGSGIVLILVLMAVASISMMGAMSLGGVQQKTRTQNMLPYHVELWRGNIMSILTSKANFIQTALDSANNPGMDCVNNNSVNCPLPAGTLSQIYWVRTVVDTGALTAAFKLDGNNGITPAGQTCGDFPSDTCPIRFKVFWACTNYCTAPAGGTRTFTVQVTPEYNPNPGGVGSTKSQVAFDPNNYAIPAKTVGDLTITLPQLYFKP